MIRALGKLRKEAGIDLQRRKLPGVLIQRMAGDVHAGGLALHLEPGLFVKFGQIGHRRRRGLDFGCTHVEQGDLARDHALELAGRAVHGPLEHVQLLAAPPGQVIKGPRADQALHALLVDGAGGVAVDEVVEVQVVAAALPLLHQLGDGVVAQVLDPRQAEAHALLALEVVHGELLLGVVDVRRQHRDAPLAQGLDVIGDLGGVAGHGIHQRRHELHRIVQLQPGGLHGHHGVGRSVGLVEGVAGEGGHLIEDLLRRLGGHAVAHAARHNDLAVFLQAVDEVLLLPGHHVVLLLGHGAAHQVASSHGIARQVAHDLHDLLLIHHAAVGHVQNRLQLRRDVTHAVRVFLARHVAGNRLHRPRAVQRNRGDDVLEVARAHALQKRPHARGFQLEHAVGVALGDHGVHTRIVEGDVLGLDLYALALLHQRLGVHDDVQRAQAQEVHLQQAQRLHVAHGELGGDDLVVHLQRQVVHHRLCGDQHARRVGGGIAGHSLQLAGHVDHPVHLGVALVGVAQLGAHLQRLLQRHVQLKGHQLGDGIRLLVAHAQHPAHVPQHRAGGHRAEGDDLRHVVRAVALPHVVDHLAAPLVVEVAVDIGHGDALGVQEALEQQVVLQGVDLRDAQGVGHDGASAAAATGAHAHAMGLGVVDEVPYDQEVVHVAHLLDHAQLVVEPVPRVLALRTVEPADAVLAERAQVGGVVGHALRQREPGQVGGGEVKLHLAALGDLLGALDGLAEVGEDAQHLLLGLDVELVGGHAHAVLVLQGLARLDAHQHLLHLGILACQIVTVVGAHQRNVHLPGQLDQPRQHLLLLGNAVVLQLDEEVAPSKDVQIALGHGARVVFPSIQQQLGQIARQAGAHGDQALVVLLQQGIVHPRAVVVTPQPALAHQRGQVLIALLVLAQQNQVAVVPGDAGLVVHVRADVHLAADHRMDALGLGRAVEVQHAVHHAVIGDGAGLHAQLLQPLHQRLDAARAVQQRIFRVQMQVCKHVSTPSRLYSSSQFSLYYITKIDPCQSTKTRSRMASSLASPMPGTFLSSSTDAYAPCSSR